MLLCIHLATQMRLGCIPNFTLPVGMICTDVLPRLGDCLILCKACSADGLCALLMVSAVLLSVLAKHSNPVLEILKQPCVCA